MFFNGELVVVVERGGKGTCSVPFVPLADVEEGVVGVDRGGGDGGRGVD